MEIQWQDNYTRTLNKEYTRVVLTKSEIGIPGICCFGYNKNMVAMQGLDNHYHDNCIELVYVVNGSITFDIQGRSFKLYGGDIFVTRANTPHSTGSAPHGISEIYWIQLSVNVLPDYLLLSAEGTECFINSLLQLRDGTLKHSSSLGQILKKAFILMDSNNIAWKHSAASLIVHFIYSMAECQKNAYNSDLTTDIIRAADYIAENIESKIELEILSSYCYLSLSRLKVKFKKQIGVSLREYINMQKIEEAKIMLLQGMSVGEVTSRLNFTTSSYFSKVFKKYTTFSPVEYKKEGGKLL